MWQYCSQTLHSLTCVNSVQQTWTRCLVGTGGHLDPAQSCTASWPCSVTISYNDKFCFVGLGGFEVTACVKDLAHRKSSIEVVVSFAQCHFFTVTRLQHILWGVGRSN